MHMVESKIKDGSRNQATTYQVKQSWLHLTCQADVSSQQDLAMARVHAQKAVDGGLEVDTTHHGGNSLHGASLSQPMVTVHVTVKSCRSAAWRISLTRTTLLLLLLRHCSIPHGNVGIVAAIHGVGIFASGDLGLLALHSSVVWICWGLTLLLCWIFGIIAVVFPAISALAAIALLLQYVSDDQSEGKDQDVLPHQPSP